MAGPVTDDHLIGRRAARIASLSRAAFARRFTTVLGEPPMAYLTRWRILLAADLLLDPNATVASVASRVGTARRSRSAEPSNATWVRAPGLTGHGRWLGSPDPLVTPLTAKLCLAPGQVTKGSALERRSDRGRLLDGVPDSTDPQ
jgi:hypothetical protein